MAGIDFCSFENIRFYQKTNLEKHYTQLKESGIPNLENRLQAPDGTARGPDIAYMMAVKESSDAIRQRFGEKTYSALEKFTIALHTGGLWKNVEELSKPVEEMNPEVKAWYVLAALSMDETTTPEKCIKHFYEVVMPGIRGDKYSKELGKKPEDHPNYMTVEDAVKQVRQDVSKYNVEEGEIPVSETGDLADFVSIAVAGNRVGICKQGDLYFVGADRLGHASVAVANNYKSEKGEDGRTIYQDQAGNTRMKVVYDGLVIAFNDLELAKEIAKTHN